VAVSELREGAGGQFDPAVVETFLAVVADQPELILEREEPGPLTRS
jgi:HD-GYP domain-containing protein (c-di-GMP phosphodiesterase class II)